MEKRQAGKLTALCALVYFSSYITRLDYAAVLVEIVQDLQIAKTTAGIAVTGSFITYGLGMVIFGVIGDQINPRTLITVGLTGTTLINLMMGVLPIASKMLLQTILYPFAAAAMPQDVFFYYTVFFPFWQHARGIFLFLRVAVKKIYKFHLTERVSGDIIRKNKKRR